MKSPSLLFLLACLTAVSSVASSIGCRKSTTAPATTTSSQTNSSENVVANEKESEAADRFVARGYIGSESCAQCHGEISGLYATHSMGKSAAPTVGNKSLPSPDNSKFTADGYVHQVLSKTNGQPRHQLSRFDKNDQLVAEMTLPVSHMIGSGRNGQSFLVNREGHLFMSPLTWYPKKEKWDLSPGYEKNNSFFNRPVIEQCLYCHTDGAYADNDASNKYDEPIVHAHVIGCERCHGPGAEHVAKHENDATVSKDLIVNPAKLSASLREAVCQQCHLSGAARILKPNKTLHDFVPGQPLSSAYTIFTLKEDGKEFVGHVEQMYQSKCFQSSEGKLGCISCHDPHSLPSAEQRVQFYREKCLACHEQRPCSQPIEERKAISTEDSCIVCHMPQKATEIQHAATTDHSVPRGTYEIAKEEAKTTSAPKLAAFPESFTKQNSGATPRDRAIAALRVTMQGTNVLESDADFNRAKLALERAVKAGKANDSAFDADTADALAELYLSEQRTDQALQVCKNTLDEQPLREATLLIVCETYSSLGQHGQATPYWERIVQVNPWMAKYWYGLGKTYAARQRWQRCQELAQEGKKRFPTSIGLRQLLVESLLQSGELLGADREFQQIVGLEPKGLGKLMAWYEGHPARK